MDSRCRRFLLSALAAFVLAPASAFAQAHDVDAGARDASVPDTGVPTPLPQTHRAPRPIANAAGTRTLVAGDYQIWVRGPLRERLIAEIASARRADLHACHRLERAVDGDGAPDARVMVRILVAAAGHVRDAIIYRGDASLRSDAAVRCIQSAVRQWRLPARREGSVIDYQFTLVAQTTDATARPAAAPEIPTGAPTLLEGTPVDPDSDTETPVRGTEGRVDMRAQVHIASSEAEVQGGLFAEDAHRVVRSHQGDVRACYEAAVRESPEAGGRITLALIVGPSGSVARATVQGSTLGNDRVEGCILDAARRWRFPPSRAGESASLRYPITLSATAR